ncbi:SUMF1/EgtB/PvdO family nonheme iron enzyme [Gemmatimonadota bacterium]
MRKAIMLLVLSSLVILSAPAISFSQTPAAVNTTYRGDINEDGNVNIFDLLGMLGMLSNPEGTTERARQIADMDESESVNIFDLLSLLQVLSGSEEPGIITWSVDETSLTGSDGCCSFTELASGTYTITPSKSGYTFNPENVQVTISDNNVAVDYFVASASVAPTTGDAKVMQGITMISIPGGTFQMGSITGESNEQPVHQVTLSAFQMSIYEITKAQYLAVMGTNPAHFGLCYKRPVESLLGNEVNTFCNKLSEAVGLEPCYDLTTGTCDFTKNGYRLPTEAEWEYACRAGTTTRYYTGDSESDLDRAGMYDRNSHGSTHAVGGREPNSFGLYDMHGNVWEVVNDWLGDYSSEPQTNPTGPVTGTYGVARGGSWNYAWYYCRSAFRGYGPDARSNYTGFRVVRGAISPGLQSIGGRILEDGIGLSGVSIRIIENVVDTTVVPDIAFASIPGGTFQMGGTTESNEQPVHQATVSEFQMSKYEITQAQYWAVMSTNPSSFIGPNNPVDRVTWSDAATFCNKLSERTGLEPCYDLSTWTCDFTKDGYRLPTEAEWEYACRAGTTTEYYTGDTESDLDRAGWWGSNSSYTTHAVGGKEANSFDLYDMHGNISEWCNDWEGDYSSESQTNPTGPQTGLGRMTRGGSWMSLDRCRSARRIWQLQSWPGNIQGFRVVRGAISPGLQ